MAGGVYVERPLSDCVVVAAAEHKVLLQHNAKYRVLMAGKRLDAGSSLRVGGCEVTTKKKV